MNKNSKQVKHNGPGRPRYEVKWPRGKFTFTDLEIENGVNPDTGRGKECTTLTLRKALKRELTNRRSGAVIHLKDALADPNSESGLGRKQYVYTRRTGVATAKASAPHKAKSKAPADVSESTTKYEATKAALLADTSVPVTSNPTPAPAPEVNPTPEAAPVAVDPAPTAEATPAPAAETAPTAEPVTA